MIELDGAVENAVALGVADVIVNDILPDRISIAWVKRREPSYNAG